MSKEKNNKVESKKEIVKRKDYKFLIDFYKEIKDLDLNNLNNKEIVKEKYIKYSNNKVFSNIERVIKRSLRVEILFNLEKELKESNLKINEYKEISYKVINLSRNKKNNLLEVEV